MKKKKGTKEYPITDERMTRFWITLDQGVDLVFKALDISQGGETFIPQIPSMKVTDLARALVPNCKFKNVGIRPGEKLHEVLVSCDEARETKILDDIYVIMPQFFTSAGLEKQYKNCPKVKDGFVFQSDVNDDWLDEKGIMKMIEGLKID